MGKHGFELLRDEQIPEINSRARLYRHVKTGAELLSIENDDENKVFGITFRTPPPDSTGVPHIMEHSVLCGSRKYPVKEPFVELLKGSLNTFLNAMTYPDMTCYPVASQNLQDFYNLIDVYLDAVFYPLLTPHTLQQEGWHFELDDPDGQMSIKGVVFNEMKGVYSSPDSLLEQYTQESLFPDTPYGVDSGGDPLVIPDLTYENFKRFHDVYYHPSNARIFFWGDDDPEQRLEILDSWLKHFERIPVESEVPLQPKFDRPRRVEERYDPGEEADGAKSMITVNWLLTEAGDPEETIALSVLRHALIGTPASPLRKALIDSGLGEDLAGSGLSTHLRQYTFSTGLKGVLPENLDRVEQLIFDTLRRLADDGIDPETIAAALNTVEFRLREQNTGAFPRGLFNMINALNAWLYERDPLAMLAFERPLEQVKAQGAGSSRYFSQMIRDCFLDNPHRTTVTLRPDPSVGPEREAAERARIEQARAAMSPDDLQNVVIDTLELRRRQQMPDTPEALATIPTLTRDDLEPRVKTIPTEVEQVGGSQILFHDLFTNGIFYLDLGFNLHNLPAEYLPYVPLFSRALTETGAGDQNFVQLLQRIGRSTGGIRPALFTSAVRGSAQSEAWLFLRGKAMAAQTGELLAILRDVLSSARLDNRERIRQMALEEKAQLESNLVDYGHHIVGSRIRAHFHEADWASEQMGGVDQLFFLRELIDRIDRDWPAVQEVFETIRRLLVNQNSMLANVTIDRAAGQNVLPQVRDFLTAQPDGEIPPAAWEAEPRPGGEGLTAPAQVNFVGKGANLYTAGYELHGSILAIVPNLRAGYLWDRIRVQGGAYGAFASFDRNSGVFSFLSYRDPNLTSTLEVYDQTVDFLRSAHLDDAELTKAIIGAIGDMDAYQLPDAKGYTAMIRRLLGITDEERQRLRDQVLGTTVDDFRALGDALGQAMERENVIVVLGSANAVQSANTALGDRLTIRKIL